ncbi:hypothetical protein BC938DRAFT_471244 [Jimgerdemannia flammicorona]|uniref:Guided entry of tail-anchored proteins 1 n=1 Tax=Jimgerdemannia flammicorona TaxID=994334 RepID=A0A433Q8L3_9FUNG|nr:hypothetical protein BC938DRAFT_471244 [Jimgerdemannia flammicorona]
MFLAVTVLLLVIITEGILWFGYSYITSLAYGVYLFLVRTETLDAQRALKKRILQLKAEIGRTSSQNEFAKWAKLRRKLDGGVAELEKLSAYWGARPFLVFAAFLFYFILFATFFVTRRLWLVLPKPITTSPHTDSDLAFAKTAFDLKFTSFLYFLVHGVQIIMVLWFRRSPTFYLPRGWFGPFEWIFALPFAPKGSVRSVIETRAQLRGSVSVAIWFVICRKVCKSSVQIVASFLPEGTAEALAHVAGVVVKQVTAWGEAAGAAVQAAVGAAVQAAAGAAVQAAAGTAVQAAAGTAVPAVEGETWSGVERGADVDVGGAGKTISWGWCGVDGGYGLQKFDCGREGLARAYTWCSSSPLGSPTSKGLTKGGFTAVYKPTLKKPEAELWAVGRYEVISKCTNQAFLSPPSYALKEFKADMLLEVGSPFVKLFSVPL